MMKLVLWRIGDYVVVPTTAKQKTLGETQS